MNSEVESLKKQVKKLYVIVCLLVVLFTATICLSFTSAFTEKQKFTEIDVERINVLEKDGTLKLVISNATRQHPGAMNGKDFPSREREAGFIFFNNEGDECGGLVYDGNKDGAGMVYSIDKYKNDQIMQLQYIEDKKENRHKYGLQLWSYGKDNVFEERVSRLKALEGKPEAEIQKGIDQMRQEGLVAQQRMFVGRNYQDDTGLFIKDQQGRDRIKIYVDSKGQPRMELLDATGKAAPLK